MKFPKSNIFSNSLIGFKPILCLKQHKPTKIVYIIHAHISQDNPQRLSTELPPVRPTRPRQPLGPPIAPPLLSLSTGPCWLLY